MSIEDSAALASPRWRYGERRVRDWMYSCCSSLPSLPAAAGDGSRRHTTPPIRVGGVSEAGEADHRIAREKEGGGVGARMRV